MGKIVQNVKFLSASQNSYLTSNLDPTRQHKSNNMLAFQNRIPASKLLKFHANRDNLPNLRLILDSWRQNLLRSVEEATGVGQKMAEKLTARHYHMLAIVTVLAHHQP